MSSKSCRSNFFLNAAAAFSSVAQSVAQNGYFAATGTTTTPKSLSMYVEASFVDNEQSSKALIQQVNLWGHLGLILSGVMRRAVHAVPTPYYMAM